MNLLAFAVRRWQVTLVAFLLLAMLGYNAFRHIPRAIPLRGGDGQLLNVGDVSSVEWAEGERLHITRLNGQRAVFIGVRKKDTTDTLGLRDAMREVRARFEPNLPPDIKLVSVFEQSNDIE